MSAKRIVACLDVRDGRVVKGTKFLHLRDVGEPVACASRYRAQGIDEVVLLDVSATLEGRTAMLDIVAAVSRAIDVPLTVGGGIRSIDDAAAILRAGADKVAVNSAAVERPSLITAIAARFGSQAVVVAIDAAICGDATWSVRVRSATAETDIDALAWAVRACEGGAGELLMTAIDRDGTGFGFDVDLIRSISARVDIPVIASGGARDARSFVDAFEAGADAALGAGLFHDARASVADVKRHCAEAGLWVRR